MPILAELAFACRDLLGWSDEEAFELLVGLSATSTEPARRLAELAGTAARRPAVRRCSSAWTRHPGPAGRDRPGLRRGLRRLPARVRLPALRYEIADPSIAETPELTLGCSPTSSPAATIRPPTRRRWPARRAAADRARRPSPGAPRDRERFERALARAERAYPVREDNEFFTTSAPLALLRYRVLEIGRRLAARGQLDRRDDVFFLTLDEARAALGDGQARRALVSRRRGERAFIEQHPGPATYGKDPGPPPPLDALPSEARFTMTALLWYIDRIFEAHVQPVQQAGGRGARRDRRLARPPHRAGPGRHGRARVRQAPAGDVLVCPVTSPVWSVLFPSVGALVTDTGGLLSHPAIIAREYRVPAVVATGNATALLRDDQLVSVDGGAGRIEVQP